MAMTNQDMTNPAPARTFDPSDPYPGIVARPLQLPDFVNVKHKNPGLSLRWVNRSVGVKESTQRLDEMIYAGFRPVRPDEILQVDQGGRTRPIMPNLIKDGKVIRGDLILMCIEREAYEGALKYNWERAVARLHPERQLATGQKQLQKAVAERGVPRGVAATLHQKLQAFRPGVNEKSADPSFLAEDDKTSTERKED